MPGAAPKGKLIYSSTNLRIGSAEQRRSETQRGQAFHCLAYFFCKGISQSDSSVLDSTVLKTKNIEAEEDVMEAFEAIFRWLHVFAGITWIGHLYFFNWVNGPFQGKIVGPTKKAVNPELMPRALYWFRWGAAYT